MEATAVEATRRLTRGGREEVAEVPQSVVTEYASFCSRACKDRAHAELMPELMQQADSLRIPQ